MVLVWLAIAMVGIIVLIFIHYINRIIILSNRIDNAKSQIDVQLKKRAELVPNLVETVKGYAKHEKDAIKMVTKAREKIVGTKSLEKKIEADKELTSALKTIFALAENYPELKANENFRLLQEQLEGIENKIAYARQFYNDSVLRYNNTVTTIPGVWFATLFGKKKRKKYLHVSEEEKEPVKVDF